MLDGWFLTACSVCFLIKSSPTGLMVALSTAHSNLPCQPLIKQMSLRYIYKQVKLKEENPQVMFSPLTNSNHYSVEASGGRGGHLLLEEHSTGRGNACLEQAGPKE